MRHLNVAASYILGGLAIAFPFEARASGPMGVEDVIRLAEKESPLMQAFTKEESAAALAIESRDLSLSSTVSSELGVVKDRRENLVTGSRRSDQSAFFDTTLIKPFASGTTLSVNGRHEIFEGQTSEDARAHGGAWELRVAQNLWRDGFGRSTRLRREAESHELSRRRLSLLLERQEFLAGVEAAFWDLVYALKEVGVREKNIERSQSLEKWMRRRVAQFAAERQDLLQVQALLGQRRLELAASQNRLSEIQARLREILPGVTPSTWQVDLGALERARAIRSLLATASQSSSAERPVRLNALVARHLARERTAEAAKVEDSLSPALSLYASYGANGIETQPGPTWNEALSARAPRSTVGVQLAMELDGSLKHKRRSAARVEAEAGTMRADALTHASNVAWEELERSLQSLKNQTNEAREILRLNRQKLEAERRRFEQGRASTLQMTTFEVEAAESELNLYRLLANLRKTEANARTFAYDKGLTP